MPAETDAWTPGTLSRRQCNALEPRPCCAPRGDTGRVPASHARPSSCRYGSRPDLGFRSITARDGEGQDAKVNLTDGSGGLGAGSQGLSQVACGPELANQLGAGPARARLTAQELRDKIEAECAPTGVCGFCDTRRRAMKAENRAKSTSGS